MEPRARNARTQSRLALGALAVALVAGAPFVLGTACGGPSGPALSRVDRVQRVRADDREYDRYFRAVYVMQVAVNEAERVHRETLAELARSLGLEDTADLETCAGRVHDRATVLQSQGLTIAITPEPTRPTVVIPDEPTGDAGAGDDAGASAEPDAVADREWNLRQDAAEAIVVVDMELRGGLVPPGTQPFLDALRRAIRRALALRRRMDAIIAAAPVFRTRGIALRDSLPARLPRAARELRGELDDAIEFFDGVAARAQVQSLIAGRIATRLQVGATTTEATAPAAR